MSPLTHLPTISIQIMSRLGFALSAVGMAEALSTEMEDERVDSHAIDMLTGDTFRRTQNRSRVNVTLSG